MRPHVNGSTIVFCDVEHVLAPQDQDVLEHIVSPIKDDTQEFYGLTYCEDFSGIQPTFMGLLANGFSFTEIPGIPKHMFFSQCSQSLRDKGIVYREGMISATRDLTKGLALLHWVNQRKLEVIPHTVGEIERHGIQFCQKGPSFLDARLRERDFATLGELDIFSENPVVSLKGIICASNRSKGTTLFNYLKRVDPKHWPTHNTRVDGPVSDDEDMGVAPQASGTSA